MVNPLSSSLSTVAIMIVALFGAAGCGESQPPAPAASRPAPSAEAVAQVEEQLGEPSDPRFIGKVWMSTTRGHALGTMMIFLPDRTLVMDSCFETYRISKWGALGDRIRWAEGTIPIEAIVSMPDENNLHLQIVGLDRVQSYVTASVPYVCPDMPK